MRKKILIDIIVIACFLLLIIILTYPLIGRICSSIFGDPCWTFDNKSSIYSIWLTKWQWQNTKSFNSNPWINYPFGVDMVSRPAQWGLRVPLLIFSLIEGEIFSFNIFVIVSYVLSSIVVYYFVIYLGGGRAGGFIAGLIYSFCPYHTLKSFSHLGLAAIQWLPLFIFFLTLLADGQSYKMAFLCALSFVITMISSYYYGYLAAITASVFLVLLLVYKRFVGLKYYFAAIIFACILLLPILFNELRAFIFTGSAKNNLDIGYIKPYYDLFRYSANVTDYFRPSEYHPIFEKLNFWFIRPYAAGARHWAEKTLYLGLAPLLLSFYGIYKARKIFDRNRQFIFVFLFLSAITAFLFSMPPEIRFGKFSVYMPSYFGYKILPMFRCPARFGLIVILFISLFAGIGTNELFKRVRSQLGKAMLFFSIFGVIVLEFTVIPPFRNVDLEKIPEVYRYIKNMESDKVFVEYPFLADYEQLHNDRYLFFQRIHKKKLINGGPGGSLGDAFRFECRDIINNKKTFKLLKYFGADYVIVNKIGYTEEELKKIKENIELKLVGDFPDAELYELRSEMDDMPVVFWQNFGSWEKWDGERYWRWIGNDATIWVGDGPIIGSSKIKVQGSRKKTIEIKFRILSFAKERELDVYINGVLIKKIKIVPQANPASAQKVVLENIMLRLGENIIRFYTPQGEDRISDIIHNGDERKVCFAISDFEITEKR